MTTFDLRQNFFDIGSQGRDVMLMLSKVHSKKKKNVIDQVDAKDINWEVIVASKAIDEGPWPKMTTYVTIPYHTSYLSVLIWCRKKTLLSTNFKIDFIF